MEEIKGNCSLVAERLDTGSADGPLVDDEKQIEQDLSDLLDTFKQLAAQPQGEGNCRGCKGNKNKLLAELKTLRLLQTQVPSIQPGWMAQRVATGDASVGMQDKISGVRDEQEQVKTAVQRLEDELSGG